MNRASPLPLSHWRDSCQVMSVWTLTKLTANAGIDHISVTSLGLRSLTSGGRNPTTCGSALEPRDMVEAVDRRALLCLPTTMTSQT
jgi:hypothetical protein